jgi:hypothetical protein
MQRNFSQNTRYNYQQTQIKGSNLANDALKDMLLERKMILNTSAVLPQSQGS